MDERKTTILSEISRDVGQVFFASVFVGPLMSGGVNFFIVLSGLVLAVLSWILSLIIINK